VNECGSDLEWRKWVRDMCVGGGWGLGGGGGEGGVTYSITEEGVGG
jgi:hypothetical protein